MLSCTLRAHVVAADESVFNVIVCPSWCYTSPTKIGLLREMEPMSV